MIALIAGTGALPSAIVDEMIAAGEMPLICVLSGFEPDVPDHLDRIGFRLETLGTLIATLKERGVTRLCMAGAIRRPDVDPSLIDAATAPLVPRIMQALGQGDDGALRVIIALFEEVGIEVVAAHEIAPMLLPRSGVQTRLGPRKQHHADAAYGDQIIAAMGAADVGQACVISKRKLIVSEDAEGTDAMLAKLAEPYVAPKRSGNPAVALLRFVRDLLRGDRGGRQPGDNGILYKAPKPDQDRRADLPVIGPDTALNAAEAGLAGIVIEAGGVMVLDLPNVIRRLDGQGMFLWVREKPE